MLILPGAELEGSLVANGCRVAGSVRHSILFPGVTVEAGAEVTGSVILPDAWIGPGARLDRAILDKHSWIGANARVGLGTAAGHAPLTLLGKYAQVPEGAEVGRGAVLGVGAGPQDFRDHKIEPGARVPDRQEVEVRP